MYFKIPDFLQSPRVFSLTKQAVTIFKCKNMIIMSLTQNLIRKGVIMVFSDNNGRRINVDRKECRRNENEECERERIRCDCDCVFECLLELLEDANEDRNCKRDRVRPEGENRRRCDCVFECLIRLLRDALEEEEEICCRKR